MSTSTYTDGYNYSTEGSIRNPKVGRGDTVCRDTNMTS
jgi:hypothetical protein